MKNFMSKSQFSKNTSWVLAGNMLHAVLAFCLSVYAGRVIDQNSFGLINYAASWLSFFSTICTLGFNGVVTRRIATDEESAPTIIWTAIISRLPMALLSIVVLQVIAGASANDPALPVIIFVQSLSLVFNSFDILVYWYRYINKAKYVAIVRLIGCLVSAVLRVYALSVAHSITLYVIAVAIETIVFTVLLLTAYIGTKHQANCFSFVMAKSMLIEAFPILVSGLLVIVYGQTDRIMLKMMVDNAAVAQYSVAATIAGAISVVPSALIEAFRPEIMREKAANSSVYALRFKQLYCILFWMCFLYSLCISVFAKQFILLLYSDSYLSAVPILTVLVWYTTFSYFGGVNSMYYVAEEKTKWIQLFTLIGAVCNIIINYILIPICGAAGAAIASLATQILTNFILVFAFPQTQGCVKYMLEGITFKWLHNANRSH